MKTYKILGLMSGTSLDGLDLACCHFNTRKGHWEYEIIAARSIPYERDMKDRLRDAIFLNGEELLLLHNEYGTWLGEQSLSFIKENALQVDFIASHGHTSHHRPGKGLTFQLGSGQHLATASGLPTLCDFRTLDVALGGQGAPLVPIGDRLLFGTYDFCLNLGGISNISFEQQGDRIAFDIGPANMLLNYLCRDLDKGYDEDGLMARKGNLLPGLFAALNQLEYYRLPFPKSTGYEWFLQEVAPLLERSDEAREDLLNTGVHHICEQVAECLKKFGREGGQTLLVTGGGALNPYLLEVLQARLGPGTQLKVPDRLLIEMKEALVFAFMGVLRMEGKTNVLSSVTGAARDSCSGVLYRP